MESVAFLGLRHNTFRFLDCCANIILLVVFFGYFLRAPPRQEYFYSSLNHLPFRFSRYDWIYVNLITDRSGYGESMFSGLLEELHVVGDTVCLAQVIRLREPPSRGNDSEAELKTLWHSESSGEEIDAI